jgi:Protein of unknown function (DUF3108)/Tetratricopeptide repeat
LGSNLAVGRRKSALARGEPNPRSILMTKRFYSRARRIAAILVSSCLVGAVALAAGPAETLSETLQKAIYTEETEGNLDEAIKLYEQVVADGKLVRHVAAQAQYRLGLALLKKGKKAEATAAFELLIKDYPEEDELVAQARKHLPSAITLGPIPWKDHEVLQLNMKLPTGLDVGTVLYRIDAEQLGGKDVWRCASRQFVTLGDNQSLSTAAVERESCIPIESTWRYTLLGDVEAIYSPKAVELKDLRKNTTREIKVNEQVYDNEQCAQLFRRLPLAVGYKTTVPVFASLSGVVIPLEIEVLGTEMVAVPAGKFDCFKLHLSIVDQTFFYSTDEHRYLVKFEAGGVTAELAQIDLAEPGKPIPFDSKEFSLTLPSNWFAYATAPSKPDDLPTTYLLNLNNRITTTISGGSRAARPESSSLANWFDADVEKAKKEIKGFVVREGSRKEIKIGGRSALSYVADFTSGDKKLSVYVVDVLGDQAAVAIKFRSEPAELDAYRATLDKVLAEMQWKP